MSDYTFVDPGDPAPAPAAPARSKMPVLELFRRLEGSGDDATSKAGARGRFQIMPETARSLGYDPARLNDPKYAKTVASAAIADLASRYPNDPDAIVVGYNASPKVLNQWLAYGRDDSVLPDETRKYLARAKSLEGEGHQDAGYTFQDPADTGPKKSKAEWTQIANDAARTAQEKARSAREHANRAQALAADARFDRTVEPITQFPQHLAEDYQARARQAGNQLLVDVKKPSSVPFGQAGQVAMDLLGEAAVPVMALGDTALGRPVSNLTGGRVKPQTVTDVASIVAPVAGEVAEGNALARAAREAGVSREALQANREARAAAPKAAKPTPARPAFQGDADYHARVDRLARRGVDLSPGQIKGGEAKTAEQQSTSGRYAGEAIKQAHQRALTSYNRAGYDEALAPIGEKYDPKGPIGREGIDTVARRIGAVYDRILPQARLVADKQTAERISEIREDHEELIGPYKGAFDSILKSRVLSRLGPDKTMDGRMFKEVESELTTLSKKYHMSNDGAQHLLGDAIDELNTALRDNMERHSPEGIRPQLKAANTAWAAYKRLEAASERRPSSMGVFTPGDLQQSVKARNRGGSFARGNAMMGQFADDGQAVLGNVVPDSGTAGRLNRTRAGIVGAIVGETAGSAIGGPVGGAMGTALGALVDRSVGSVTNSLAGEMLRRESLRLLGRSDRTPHNYLRAAQQRALTHSLPALGARQIGDGQ